MSSWWPLAHYKIGRANAVAAVVEPFAGGRWYEKGEDGSTCDWGKVLAWEPTSRLLLTWDINADFQYDPELGTELEIRFFIEGDNRTRVELEHRRLDRFGARRDEMRAIFDKSGDWGRLLVKLWRGGCESPLVKQFAANYLPACRFDSMSFDADESANDQRRSLFVGAASATPRPSTDGRFATGLRAP